MATSYTEFCCRSGGSNLNAGTRTGSSVEPGTAADLTYASGTWVNSTGVFTVPSGNPITDGVAVGDFASVYADGSTVTGFIGRVSARTATTITVSGTSAMGAKPTDGTSNRTLKVGGAWAGPNTTDQAFPLALANIDDAATVTTTFPVRINFKNDQTYTVSASTTNATNGPFTMQGYTTSYGDGGRATLTGGTSGASFNLLVFTGILSTQDFIFINNGATGSAHGVTSANRHYFKNCVFTGMLGAGLSSTAANIGAGITMDECEIYGNNTSNTASIGGLLLSNQATLSRCYIHDNAGGNVSGVHVTATVALGATNCIFSGNGLNGIGAAAGGALLIVGCDFYSNGGSGIALTTGGVNFNISAYNCNFVKNSGWGINLNTFTSVVTARFGTIANCGFGVGTQANTSGDINTASNGIGNIQEIGSVNYATGVTPWVDPANGDFRINLSTAKGTGRGTFVETAAGKAGTIGYPDIGAAQHLEAASGGHIASRQLTGM